MKTGDAIYTQIMEQLRDDGWCVVLKVLPKELPFLIEGSRSEYDAPCPDQPIGKGKWCCEIQDMRWDGTPASPYRGSHFAFGESPEAVLHKILDASKPKPTKAQI